MKKVSIIAGICLWAFAAFPDLIEWSAEWTADDAVPFDTVVIGRILGNTASPLNDDGVYIGYSNAEGFWQAAPQYFEDIGLSDWQESTIEISDFGSTQGYYYFMELYAGDQRVAYSDLTGYDVLKYAIHQSTFATQPWDVTSFTSTVPEPSSGVLLLIGGALLGLRRKRKQIA